MYQAVIVDDELFIVDGLKNSINWEGYHFEIACAVTNPLKALEYIQRNNVQLLITDVSMPEMDGLELLKKAKELNPLLSVIVLSAFDHFEFVRTALRYGAENYLLKPLDPDELSDAISQIVNHMQEREQLSNTYGQAMLSFRSNFTELWVKNALSNEDMKTKATLLGVNLEADNFTIVIFSSLSNSSQSMSTFFDLLLSYLPGRFLGHFYFETPLRLVCILSALDSKKTSTPAFLDEVLKSAVISKISVFAAMGNVVNHYSEVGISYQQSRSLLFLKYTGSSCFIYEDLKNMVTRVAKLKDVFQTTDFSKAPSIIESLFADTQSLHMTKLLTIEMISYLLQKIEIELDEIVTKFPHIVELLNQFPKEPIQCNDYKLYVLNFLKQCNQLQEIIRQSMYPCVDAVIKAVYEFSDKDISLKTLAQKLNVSPSYLGTIFKQQTGFYFNDYLSEARLKYAAKLIETSDMKMKDIVDKVGFSSQTYFNRTFKRYYNISPVAYRRQKITQ